MTFPYYTGDLPYITTAQMVEVDRAMIEDYRIDLVRMMENAGRTLAQLARGRFFDGDPRNRQVVVLAGTGGNGGGALVCARRLHNWGAQVRVLVTKSAEHFTPVPGEQLAILQQMGVAIDVVDDAVSLDDPVDLIVDGVIGYSLKGAPRGASKVLIEWANDNPAPVLSLDVPSGIDTATGTVYDPAIQATATMTLALPKVGLRGEGVEAHVGELYLADISVPPGLYASPALGLDVGPIFAQSDVVQLR